MSDGYEFMTVNSGYINGDDSSHEENDDDFLGEQFEALIRNHSGNAAKETPLPDPPSMFESKDEQVHVPTSNNGGKETPLLDIEMDW